jgi:quercetin dioxygenase-like cupin family protein
MRHVHTALRSLPELVVTADTSAAEAEAAMQALTSFNGCMVGVVRFTGRTPWERHPDDELLYVLEGAVDVTVLTETGTLRESLAVGDVYVVPKDSWHRQHTAKTTALLFVTSEAGNAVSDAEDPRAGSAATARRG